MRPLSIRVRLTLWYFAVLTVTFAAFGAGVFLAARESIHAAIDEDLRVRLEGVDAFLKRHDPTVSLEDAQDEFVEHSGLRPGGDLVQVSDARRDWIFRSLSMSRYSIDPPADGPRIPRYETLDIEGRPLRLLSAEVMVAASSYTVQLAAVSLWRWKQAMAKQELRYKTRASASQKRTSRSSSSASIERTKRVRVREVAPAWVYPSPGGSPRRIAPLSMWKAFQERVLRLRFDFPARPVHSAASTADPRFSPMFDSPRLVWRSSVIVLIRM